MGGAGRTASVGGRDQQGRRSGSLGGFASGGGQGQFEEGAEISTVGAAMAPCGEGEGRPREGGSTGGKGVPTTGGAAVDLQKESEDLQRGGDCSGSTVGVGDVRLSQGMFALDPRGDASAGPWRRGVGVTRNAWTKSAGGWAAADPFRQRIYRRGERYWG